MYVFDTDVVSLTMKGRLAAATRARMAALAPDRRFLTSITLGELYYGALRAPAAMRWLDAIERVRSMFRCLPFDEAGARRYGELRSHLEAQGRRLDDADLRIAAICSATDHILVTGNSRHFARVPGLRCENWL